jgi:hypothetical protein
MLKIEQSFDYIRLGTLCRENQRDSLIKSRRDKAMESKSRLELRIATGLKNILIGPLIPVIFQSFHFA